jgi:muramidase (phage lysozyme)
MPNYLAQQYAQLIASNPLVKRFLDVIGWAEGATYNTGYGNRQIGSLASHPYAPCSFTRSGNINPVGCQDRTATSAAGKYQFQRGTWEDAKRALGLTDFSPESQDLAALWLIDKKRGALPDVIQGNVTSAVMKLRNEWESFAVRPLSSIVSKFGGQGSVSAPNVANTYGAQSQTVSLESKRQENWNRFNSFIGTTSITSQQRYMIAFAILVIIFIFAFA